MVSPQLCFFLMLREGEFLGPVCRLKSRGLMEPKPGHGTPAYSFRGPTSQRARNPLNSTSVASPNSRCAFEATPLQTTISKYFYVNLAKTPRVGRRARWLHWPGVIC
jgi:hypothetical protein